MEPRVTPIDATLGAVVTEVALARMDAPAWTAVEHAFHAHAVLVSVDREPVGDGAT